MKCFVQLPGQLYRDPETEGPNERICLFPCSWKRRKSPTRVGAVRKVAKEYRIFSREVSTLPSPMHAKQIPTNPVSMRDSRVLAIFRENLRTEKKKIPYNGATSTSFSYYPKHFRNSSEIILSYKKARVSFI